MAELGLANHSERHGAAAAILAVCRRGTAAAAEGSLEPATLASVVAEQISFALFH